MHIRKSTLLVNEKTIALVKYVQVTELHQCTKPGVGRSGAAQGPVLAGLGQHRAQYWQVWGSTGSGAYMTRAIGCH